jgi:hypothetical protein
VYQRAQFPLIKRRDKEEKDVPMDTEKVYVNEAFDGIVICPQCEKRKRANFSAYRGHGSRTLKVKCTCETQFQISIDFRRAYRKKTDFPGMYTRLSYKKDKGDMHILNLSANGIGFRTTNLSVLSIGDKIRMQFTLDDQKQSEIEIEGVVRNVDGNYVGCEFTDPSQHQRTLGFYLMP